MSATHTDGELIGEKVEISEQFLDLLRSVNVWPHPELSEFIERYGHDERLRAILETSAILYFSFQIQSVRRASI